MPLNWIETDSARARHSALAFHIFTAISGCSENSTDPSAIQPTRRPNGKRTETVSNFSKQRQFKRMKISSNGLIYILFVCAIFRYGSELASHHPTAAGESYFGRLVIAFSGQYFHYNTSYLYIIFTSSTFRSLHWGLHPTCFPQNGHLNFCRHDAHAHDWQRD